MSVIDDEATPDVAQDEPVVAPASRGLRITLVSIIAIAVLVLAGVVGWLARGGSDDSSPTKVDLGFAQDMITHHTQAVTMAGIERDGTAAGTPLHTLSFDIETSQQFQIGEMSGWLDNWNKSQNNPDPMAWMGSDHMAMGAGDLMPGMATPDQMNELVRAKGKALDILFLQLMIHHHQGGIPMAQYALQHGHAQYVRDMAQSMINSQSSEIISMETMLRQLGGKPLPPPA